MSAVIIFCSSPNNRQPLSCLCQMVVELFFLFFVFLRARSAGVLTHKLVSSCHTSSVQHRKDFAVTKQPFQDAPSLLLSVILLYIQKSQKSAN